MPNVALPAIVLGLPRDVVATAMRAGDDAIRPAAAYSVLAAVVGIVIKSHGSADRQAFAHALARAVDEVKNDVPKRIALKMAELPVHAA